MSNVTNITTKQQPTKAEAIKPDLVLKADERIATKFVKALLGADNAVTSATRDFSKGFAHNHEGQLPKAIKAGFKALRDSGVFSNLGEQRIKNLSSCVQWIAAQPYSVQDAIFEAENFKDAYEATRWPKTEAVATAEGEEGDDDETIAPTTPRAKATHAPVTPQSFDGACNDIAVELNGVIERIAEVYNQYASDSRVSILSALALDIGAALEKAAHARLAVADKVAA